MPPKPGTKPLKQLKKGMGLYKVMYMPSKAPDKSKPWAVINLQTHDVNGRWHASESDARDQAKAMYSSMGNKARYGMSEAHSYLTQIEFAEHADDLLWLEALPAKVWHTVEFGEVPITTENLQRMVDNFYGNVRGQEVATDFEHGRDVSKGSKASGWIKEAEIRDESLWLGVKPTPTAVKELENGEWKYFSLEWDDFVHPETQEYHKDVIMGGGFTNRPIAKGLVPINFSELFEVKAKAFANKKPYGDVTYADPGYQKDGVKRYPLDTEKRIRAAWSYINVPSNAKKYTSSQVSSIKGRIKSAMKGIGAKVSPAMSEQTDAQIEEELNTEIMPEDEANKIVNEHADLEHQEPGSNDPDPNTNPDDSFPDRHVTPPADTDDNSGTSDKKKEDGVDKEVDAKLRDVLGIGEDADIVKAATELKEKVGPLEEVAKQFSERKKFAEMFPEEAKELEASRIERRENAAIKFSEEIGSKRFSDNKGLSAKALEKIAGLHKAFSEGTANVETFAEVIDTIADEGGLVEFGERGSQRVDSESLKAVPENPRLAFAEKVKEVMESDKLEYSAAITETSKRYPELARAYAAPVVA